MDFRFVLFLTEVYQHCSVRRMVDACHAIAIRIRYKMVDIMQ